MRDPIRVRGKGTSLSPASPHPLDQTKTSEGVLRQGSLGSWKALSTMKFTLLHIVEEGLQLGVCLGLLTQSVQEQVVL